MQWNLRLAAAQRGIWRSSDLRRLLADAGLEISVGKMSHLWSGRPISIRLDDLDVICAVLGCEPGDLLVRDPSAGTAACGEEPRAASPSPSAIRPAVAAAGRGRRYELPSLAGDHLYYMRGDRARPSQDRPVQALQGPAQHPVRPCASCGQARRHLAAGLCARCYRLARTRLVICPGGGELRPVYFGDQCERGQRRAAARPVPARTVGNRWRGCGRAAAAPAVPGSMRPPAHARTAVT